MLTLYHGKTSVCSIKARLALAEKGVAWEGRLITLRGDQFDPDYMKLNPNAVVPTLVHDGKVVIEFDRHHALCRRGVSRPRAGAGRSDLAREAAHDHEADGRIRARFLHHIDVRDCQPRALRPHECGGIRGRARQVARSEALRDQAPGGQAWARSAVGGGCAPSSRDAARSHRGGDEGGAVLAGAGCSLADAAATPYVWRLDKLKLARMWEHRPGVAAWYERIRARPSFKAAVEDWVTPADHERYAKEPDPWPKVSEILRAA